MSRTRSTGYRAIPQAVVLPASTAEVSAVIGVCAVHGIPFVARGAGTGLSGGAVPVAEGIVIGLARMNQILEVDVPNRRVRAAARRHQPRCHQGGRGARALLRARSVQPAGVHDRRQRGRELRRRPLPQVRVHQQPCGRGRAGAGRRRGGAAGPREMRSTFWARSSAPRGRSASSPRSTVGVLPAPAAG